MTGRRDDVRARRRRRAARRGHDAAARRRDAVAQLGAAHARRLARQGRARRFLDVLLHQLHPRAAVCEGVVREVSRPGSRRDRRSLAGVRVREEPAATCSAKFAISVSLIPSRSTTTTRFGARSRTNIGPRTTSSTRWATSATRISAKASTTVSERVIQQLLAEAGSAGVGRPSSSSRTREGAALASDQFQRAEPRDLPRPRRARRTSPRRAGRCPESRTPTTAPPRARS